MLSKRISMFFVLLVMIASLSGCIFLIVGGMGAVGGYAITRDTIQGEYDVKFDDAWRSALKVCDTLGFISSKDRHRGIIDATVDNAKVKVDISQLTPETIRIKVKARKGIFPRIGTADKVFVKIVQYLVRR